MFDTLNHRRRIIYYKQRHFQSSNYMYTRVIIMIMLFENRYNIAQRSPTSRSLKEYWWIVLKINYTNIG